MHRYFYVFILLICNSLLSFPWGRWYPDYVNECILGNTGNEEIVSGKRRDKRNTLCDEQNIYINNFFPYVCEDRRQLADILKDHFGNITDEDLQRLKNKTPTKQKNDNSPRPYVESFLKYLEACKVYIKTINNFIVASDEDKKADEKVFTDIIAKIERPYNYNLLNNIITHLGNKNIMGRIWNKMHTENLFLFDHYYNEDLQNPDITIPTNRICFVSHFDMCGNCEKMMVKLVGKMDECPSMYFNKNQQYSYKILIGSFEKYFDSRERNNSSKLLKIKRS